MNDLYNLTWVRCDLFLMGSNVLH